MSTAQLAVTSIGVLITAAALWYTIQWNRRRHAERLREIEATAENVPAPVGPPAVELTVSSTSDNALTICVSGTIVGELGNWGLCVLRQLQTGNVPTYTDGGQVVLVGDLQWNRRVPARDRVPGVQEEYAVVLVCPEDLAALRSRELDGRGAPLPLKLSARSRVVHVVVIDP